MCSEVKWGSCFRYESLDHMAWVTIWASSIAASAGLSQPLLDSTSTQAWIRRIAYKQQMSARYAKQVKHRNTTWWGWWSENEPCSEFLRCLTGAQHSAAFWRGEPAAAGSSSHEDRWTWGCSACGALSVPTEIKNKTKKVSTTVFTFTDFFKELFFLLSKCRFYLSEKCVLKVPDGNVLILGCIGDDFNQASDLCLGIQGHAEQLCPTEQQQTSSYIFKQLCFDK